MDEINILMAEWMDDHYLRYSEAERYLRVATYLIEPTEVNVEYERALADVVTELMGLALGDHAEGVLEMIQFRARRHLMMEGDDD